MTDDQVVALRRLAGVSGRSQAAILRDALDELLRSEARVRAADRARDVIGAFRSAMRDTAEEHDHVVARSFDAHFWEQGFTSWT